MTTSNFPRSFPRCVYHGTLLEHWDSIRREILIHRPHAKVNLDFGKGFYTTTNLQQAAERAYLSKKLQSLQTSSPKLLLPIVITFVLNSDLLYNRGQDEFRIFHTHDEQWAQFILSNRLHPSTPSHPFRWTYGPLADGDTQFLCRAYQQGRISMQEFIHGFHDQNGKWVRGLKPYREGYDQLVFHDGWVNEVLTDATMQEAHYILHRR